jgi:hypothetical protein
MRISRSRTAAVAALAVLGAAAPAGAQTLAGTVVHHDGRAHSFVVAERNGHLAAVHASKLPAVGRVVRVNVTRLHNGTFAAHAIHLGAHVAHVHLRGVVTYVDHRRHGLVISARGVSLLVRTHGARFVKGRGAHAAADTPAPQPVPPTSGEEGGTTAPPTPAPAPPAGTPVPGTKVDVQAQVPGSGTPVAQTVTNDGKAFSINLEGTILDVDPAHHTVTISAEDDSFGGGKITISVPDSIDLTVLSIFAGQQVDLAALLSGSDGSLSLGGLADDGSDSQADDPSGMFGSLFAGGDAGGSDGSDGLDF